MPVRDPSVPRPFHTLIGLRVEPCPEGGLRAVLPANPHLTNSRGEIHGGVIATLLDVALGSAAMAALPEGASCATVTLTVTYLQIGRGDLVGTGRVLRAGRTLVNVEGRVMDGQGALIAQAVGTFRALRSREPGRG
jgi:uncharacterized protein (TIGR00369 family)